ncbi:NAD(P)-dependent oxidoreductase [Pseudonocardia pini]|uniref:NAD(P)-dependent oxidoreductase n=1 Tax=Pseudonocardia pini TaxID=2758030 RepID=UPI0015F11CD6|nr:hydroxyacid dehydrogenase [Pseudonocardia pini]
MTARRYRVLVPTTLHDPRAEEVYAEAGDIDVEYALAPEERPMGGGPLGPAGQRAKAEQAVRERIAEFDVVGALPGRPFVTAELLERADRLKVVYIASAGYDSIDVEAATARGVAVVNAAGNNVVPVAEHAVGLLLSVSRKIGQLDRRAHRERRGLHFTDVGAFPPELAGGTLGLVGFGAIGRRVARIAGAGLGMSVLVHDPFLDPDQARSAGVEPVAELDELLARADAVSLHLPLTEGTRGLIGARELARMREGAFLVNTARGPVVDTDALVDALRSGHLGGAGLDVTDPEPLPAGHPLFDLDTVVLTPHHAGASPTAIAKAYLMSATAVVDALHGREPATLVNGDVWPSCLQRWKREQ